MHLVDTGLRHEHGRSRRRGSRRWLDGRTVHADLRRRRLERRPPAARRRSTEAHGKLATVTAVRPPVPLRRPRASTATAAFRFTEKPQIGEGWINGGFMVLEPEVLDYIEGDDTSLEADVLEQISPRRASSAPTGTRASGSRWTRCATSGTSGRSGPTDDAPWANVGIAAADALVRPDGARHRRGAGLLGGWVARPPSGGRAPRSSGSTSPGTVRDRPSAARRRSERVDGDVRDTAAAASACSATGASTPSSTSRPRRSSGRRSTTRSTRSATTSRARGACSRPVGRTPRVTGDRGRLVRQGVRRLGRVARTARRWRSRARHPYDVSKAVTDMLAQSYAATYGLPVAITRCGNLYGGGDLNWSRIVPGTIRSVLEGEPPGHPVGRDVRARLPPRRRRGRGVLLLADAVRRCGIDGRGEHSTSPPAIRLTVLAVVRQDPRPDGFHASSRTSSALDLHGDPRAARVGGAGQKGARLAARR